MIAPSPIRNRKSLSIPATAAFLLAVLGCGGGGEESPAGDSGAVSPAGSARREVVVHSPHGQEMLDEFEKLFEAAHPEIDVIGRFVPTGQILSQLRIDKSSPRVDVWWGGTTAFFGEAVREGLLQPYEPSWSGVARPDYRDPAHHWYAQFVQVPAVMFNSALMKPEDAPARWDDLLDPKWKDRIVIREPRDSGTMKTILTGLIWSRAGDGPDRDPAPGLDFLKRLDANTRKYLPNPQALYDQVAKSREGYLSLWNLTDIVFQARANGYPFGFRVPEDPVPVSLDPIGIVAGAPHLEEARLFYEFVTSKESCLRLASEHYRILARTDVAPEELPEVLREARYTAMEFEPGEFDRMQIEWFGRWEKEVRDPEK